MYKDTLVDCNVASIPYYRTKKVRWRTKKIIKATSSSKEERLCLCCCKNYHKECLVVSKLLNKICNQRKDSLRQPSTISIENHGIQ